MYKFIFQRFQHNPKNVGAIVPLSQSVAAQFIKHLSMRSDAAPWKILKAGAGKGKIIRSLVAHMKAHDTLDVVEINPESCNLLKSRYEADKRVSIHCMPILDWQPKIQYDFIVSTLPMNSFIPSFVNDVLNHYKHLGNQEAICTYVEYIGIGKLKSLFANKEARKIIIERRKILNTFHKNHLLEKNKVFANLLPCYVYHLKLHPTYAPNLKSAPLSDRINVQKG
ncbi:MAG: hypothetical protein H0X29_11080 [Parachlamydiaceae bacterium]|nr:hypothetical protein [Parachlamydiaceae bacterium]